MPVDKEIYIGKEINGINLCRTKDDYRININGMAHGMITGQSRSGKTIAGMRFVKELVSSRQTETLKHLRIVCLDPKQDWRGIAKHIAPKHFRFYSLGRMFQPINLNPCKIPHGVQPQYWIDGIVEIYCRTHGILENGRQLLSEAFYDLYEKAGVFDVIDDDDWMDKVPEASKKVTFAGAYKWIKAKLDSLDVPTNQGECAGNDMKDAYARLLKHLQCFAKPYSIERKLFSKTEEDELNKNHGDNHIGNGIGLAVDELIGDDDVTVFEGIGLAARFESFAFGVIAFGLYAMAQNSKLSEAQSEIYETMMVIENAEKILLGNNIACTADTMSAPGQSVFEEILERAADYGFHILSITQMPSLMPPAAIANCSVLLAGRLISPQDADLVARMVGIGKKIDEKDITEWLPELPTGQFIGRTRQTANTWPDMAEVEPLNNILITDRELENVLAIGRIRRSARCW